MMRKTLDIFLVILYATTIAACTNIRVESKNPTQPEKIPEEECHSTADQIAELLSDGFIFVRDGDDDKYGCVGQVINADNEFVGSGVLIKSNIVITAAHCLDENLQYFQTKQICYKIKHKIPHPNYSLYKQFDIAILVLEEPCTEACAVITDTLSDLTQYEDLTTVGYSLHIKKVSKKNTFVYYGILIQDPLSIKFLPLNGTVWFGDSGGAVFEESGKLVGIISSFTVSHDRILDNSAMNLYLFREWIDQVAEQEK